MVTDKQVKLMRQKRMEGKTQETAAAVAGMSERTARKWEKEGSPMPSETTKPRTWRTRSDPFAGVWESDIVPLLEADEKGVLHGTTLLEELQERHPGQFEKSQVRTLPAQLVVPDPRVSLAE